MTLVSIPANPVPEDVVTGTIKTPDGAELRFARWAPPAGRKGTVCLFTGRGEQIEKYFETVRDLRDRGFAVPMIDLPGRATSLPVRTLLRIMRFTGQGGRYVPGGSDHLTGTDSFINNPLTSDPVRYARNAAILEEDPTLGIASPTVAWADTAFRAMNTFRGVSYPSEIRQPILMLAASNDSIVSTSAIEEFAYHLRAGSHLVIAGSKHEILQEQDRYRAQFWAAFDAFVPGTPLLK